jgi:hypothetical protein
MKQYTPEEKKLLRIIVKETPGTPDFFQKTISEKYFTRGHRPFMLVNMPKKQVIVFCSKEGYHAEFNGLMNLVAVMEDLEADRLIIRLPESTPESTNPYSIGELFDAKLETIENGRMRYISPTTGKYIYTDDLSKLLSEKDDSSEDLSFIVIEDPRVTERLANAFSGLVYPRETLIDLVKNNFRSVAQRRHRQTMCVAWAAIGFSLFVSLASGFYTLNESSQSGIAETLRVSLCTQPEQHPKCVSFEARQEIVNY